VPGRRSIFLSYRRQETSHLAGRLADRLFAQFGEAHVFMDVDSIVPGSDFGEAIERAVNECAVLLALIGRTWTSLVDAHGRRRLDDPDDLVVLELQAALDRAIPVIPVLVDGAKAPTRDDLPPTLGALARRQAMRIDHDTFRADCAALLHHVGRIVAEAETDVRDLAERSDDNAGVTVKTGSDSALADEDREVTQQAQQERSEFVPEKSIQPGIRIRETETTAEHSPVRWVYAAWLTAILAILVTSYFQAFLVFRDLESYAIADAPDLQFSWWGGVIAPIAAAIGASLSRRTEWVCVGLVAGASASLVNDTAILGMYDWLTGYESYSYGPGYLLMLSAAASLILLACILGRRINLGFASVSYMSYNGQTISASISLLVWLVIAVGINAQLILQAEGEVIAFVGPPYASKVAALVMICLVVVNRGSLAAAGRVLLLAAVIATIGDALVLAGPSHLLSLIVIATGLATTVGLSLTVDHSRAAWVLAFAALFLGTFAVVTSPLLTAWLPLGSLGLLAGLGAGCASSVALEVIRRRRRSA
jgi:hypothetical protein